MSVAEANWLELGFLVSRNTSLAVETQIACSQLTLTTPLPPPGAAEKGAHNPSDKLASCGVGDGSGEILRQGFD